jgi:PQQ-like domain
VTRGWLIWRRRGALMWRRRGALMSPRRRAYMWLRRGIFVALLVAAAITPGPASAARPCTIRACQSGGVTRWARVLPGSWVAQSGLDGTTPAQGEAYAAMSGPVAAIGAGLTIHAYRSRTGAPLWASSLTGFRAGARIVSVRVWPGVVTAGVQVPGAQPGAVGSRQEVVLAGPTGRLLRSYPAAAFGGAVSADSARTVIVGDTAVTSYSNRTGAVLWSQPTGSAAQAWKIDSKNIYLTVAAGGYLSGAPVRALRKVNLRTGAQRLVRPPGQAFPGVLSRALAGVVVFTDARGTVAYSGSTGAWLWRRYGATPQNADPVDSVLYLSHGNTLVGVDPWTGRTQAHVSGGSAAGASGFYAVRGGIVLGLDQGAPGDAWGYDVAAGRVIWTNPSLPWPHYFVDLSGVGGSAGPRSTGVLLAICARLSTTGSASAGQACAHPELVALNW